MKGSVHNNDERHRNNAEGDRGETPSAIKPQPVTKRRGSHCPELHALHKSRSASESDAMDEKETTVLMPVMPKRRC